MIKERQPLMWAYSDLKKMKKITDLFWNAIWHYTVRVKAVAVTVLIAALSAAVGVAQLERGTDEQKKEIEVDENKNRTRENREELIRKSNAKASWQKLAVFPDRWIGEPVALSGWIEFDITPGLEGHNSQLVYLFDSRESAQFFLPYRRVQMNLRDVLEALDSDVEYAKALLLRLREKCVRVRGTFDLSAVDSNLGGLRRPLKIEVLRRQSLESIPKELIEHEVATPDQK